MKLSVITINYNNAVGLKKTLESVASQTFRDFEHIIIDGASTDGSVDIANDYQKEVNVKVLYTEGRASKAGARVNVRVVSEKDTGIYNAMNKGIRMATGEYIHFLNSGDYLVNENVYDDVFKAGASADIFYGNRINIYSDGSQQINKGTQRSNLTFNDIYRGCIPHTAAFTKRSLFQSSGMFDESFKIMSDTGFFLKAIGLDKATTQYIDVTVSYFDMNGISQDPRQKSLFQKEFDDMHVKLLGSELNEAYLFYLKYNKRVSSIMNKRMSKFIFRIASWISRR